MKIHDMLSDVWIDSEVVAKLIAKLELRGDEESTTFSIANAYVFAEAVARAAVERWERS